MNKHKCTELKRKIFQEPKFMIWNFPSQKPFLKSIWHIIYLQYPNNLLIEVEMQESAALKNPSSEWDCLHLNFSFIIYHWWLNLFVPQFLYLKAGLNSALNSGIKWVYIYIYTHTNAHVYTYVQVNTTVSDI